MMSQEHEFNYVENDQLQVLELPYAGNDLSMTVLLPKKHDGLAELESSLTAHTLRSLVAKSHEQTVTVYLPRFKLTSQFSLQNTLAAMGMPDAFSQNTADFSAMDGNRMLYISAVVHKAFVDVNEEGTEAAAATGVVVSVTAMPVRPAVFRADHPFVFLIRDIHSGSILFLGRVVDPTK
jgi:serpin B